jgi:hypothetical protein
MATGVLVKAPQTKKQRRQKMSESVLQQQLKVPPPEMFDDYDTGQWVPPPQAKELGADGKAKYIQYEAQAPGVDKFSWRGDKNGYLMLVIEGIKLVSGYEFRKDYLSSAPFPKRDRAGNVTGTRNASTLGNYFRAHGMAVRPATEDEYRAYAEATADRTFYCTIDWEAYDGDTQSTVADSWDAFPDDPEHPGQKQAYIERNDKRFWARARIKRFIDQVK